MNLRQLYYFKAIAELELGKAGSEETQVQDGQNNLGRNIHRLGDSGEYPGRNVKQKADGHTVGGDQNSGIFGGEPPHKH